MAWKSLEYKDRWILIVAAIQSLATLGTFIVALVGLWRISPIITYRIERQQKEESSNATLSLLQSKEVGDKFVGDALAWWKVQVNNYERVMELIKNREQRNLDITYNIEESTASNVPDLMVLTAVDVDGKAEVVKVPINAKAMPPTQYIQQKINQGAFSSLSSPMREKIENSITHYMQAHMQPKVPPPYIRVGMSLEDVYEEISYSQNLRNQAIQHIRSLKGVIDEAKVID